ncbi:MAG: LuxR C-terminal-related transcriptional regulator [Nocardioidaceae bacterium]
MTISPARETAPETGPTEPLGLASRFDLLDRLRQAGAEGRCALLVGPPGVGKTHLLTRHTRTASDSGAVVVLLAATAATRTIPFGVFLPLLTPREPAPAEILTDDPAQVAAVVRARIDELGPEFIGVDDLHLVDPASAQLLLELVTAGHSVVASVRPNAPTDAALGRLVNAVATVRLPVSNLDAAETHRLASATLGGPVDGALAQTLYERSGGNPLTLGELVRAAVSNGAIAQPRGVWRLEGPLPPVTSMVVLLSARLDSVSRPVRRLVELLALGEPLSGELARDLVGEDTLQLAAESGMVALTTGDGAVRLRHLLWRDAALLALPALRRRRLLGDLADGLERRGAVSAPELLRVGRWRLDRGETRPAEELVGLSRLARSAAPALAEEFARAAVEADGGVPALLALLAILVREEKTAEALDVSDRIDAADATPDQAAAALLLRARLLAASAHRPRQAIALLDRNKDALSDSAAAAALRIFALWRLGKVTEAQQGATTLLADPDTPVDAAVDAAVVGAYAAIYAGDRGGYAELLSHLTALARQPGAHLPDGPATMQLIEAGAAQMLGIDQAVAQAAGTTAYAAAVKRGDDGVRAQFAVELGWTHVLGGQMPEGVALLREAYAASGAWTESSLPWVRSMLGSALVLAGDLKTATTVVTALGEAPRPPVYDADVAIAEAALAAGRGNLGAAGRRARAGAAAAESLGQRYLARVLWYAAMRYADAPAATSVLRTLDVIETEADEAVARHARAIGNLDADEAERAATALAALGLHWFATEAQAQAVLLHGRGPRPGRAALAAERLGVLLTSTKGFDSPVVRLLNRPVLSAREAEVARHAAAGLSDREVAERLGLSVRTAQTHLTRIYHKLGIAGRVELSRGLRPELG